MSEPLFDKSSEYDLMLAEGLKLSGESKDYFIHGRLKDLKNSLPSHFQPKRILDYGCGLGETSGFLSDLFPQAQITGVDTSENAIQHARKQYTKNSLSFFTLDQLPEGNLYDFCYTNGVFHHIEPQHRQEALKGIYRRMIPGGIFAFFENNPWNPGTRLVMSRIAFDRGARTLSFREAKSLLTDGGFKCIESRFLFYFPKALSFLRFLEPLGLRIPLGAQYCVLSTK